MNYSKIVFVAAAFVALADEFQAIAARFADSDEALQTKAAFLFTVTGHGVDPVVN